MTFYGWNAPYRDGGNAALEHRQPSSPRTWSRIPDTIREAILKLALERPELAARELAVVPRAAPTPVAESSQIEFSPPGSVNPGLPSEWELKRSAGRIQVHGYCAFLTPPEGSLAASNDGCKQQKLMATPCIESDTAKTTKNPAFVPQCSAQLRRLHAVILFRRCNRSHRLVSLFNL